MLFGEEAVFKALKQVNLLEPTREDDFVKAFQPLNDISHNDAQGLRSTSTMEELETSFIFFHFEHQQTGENINRFSEGGKNCAP